MAIAAAADTAQVAPTPEPAADAPKPKAAKDEPAKSSQMAAAEAAITDGPPPKIQKVDQLRALLATKKAIRERDATAVAVDRGTRTKAERDADKPDPKTGKVAAKAEKAEPAKEPAKAKEEPKPAAGERDEHGRFLPKDGVVKPLTPKPAAPKPADDDVPPAAASATEERIEEVTDKLADAGVKAPAQKAEETDKKYELRISRLLLDAKEKDQKLREAETKRAAAEERAAKADAKEKLLERLRGDQLDEDALYQVTGKTWREFVTGVGEGRTKFTPRVNMPPEMKRVQDELTQTLARAKEREDALDRAEREKSERAESEARETRRKQVEETETATVRSFLDVHADTYPILSSYKNAPAKFLQTWYATWSDKTIDAKTGKPTFAQSAQPSMEEVAAIMEASLGGELDGIISSERALRTALKNPATRDLVQKLLADTQSQQPQSPQRENKGNQTASPDGPRTLSKKVTQEVPVLSDRPPSKDERAAQKAEAFAHWLSRRKAAGAR